MKPKYLIVIWLALLTLTFWFPGARAQNFNLTEYDTLSRAIIKTIVPYASTVRLRGLPGSWGLNGINLPFTNIIDSLWQVRTEPVSIGFHYYRVEINGVTTVNPNEWVYYGGNAWTSGLEVPGDGDSFYSIRDVVHGTIRMQQYYSSVTQSIRRCFIYLPPSYATQHDETYPVLFLQHGNSENEYSWHMQGKVSNILDNLIADGSAVPMIVVMDNGMTFLNDAQGFAELVINDLIPLLEDKYRVKTGRLNRAVAGLSMGGSQAMVAGLFNTNIFGYVGNFSSGFTTMDWTPYAQNINDSIELLWMGSGTADEYFSYFNQLDDNLNDYNVNHITVRLSGAHQWQVWRNCLARFAPLLFKSFTYPPESISNNTNETSYGLVVYPNPFTGYLHIDLNRTSDTILQYELLDASGRQCFIYRGEKLPAEQNISNRLNSLPGNIYILIVSDSKTTYRSMIIKNF